MALESFNRLLSPNFLFRLFNHCCQNTASWVPTFIVCPLKRDCQIEVSSTASNLTAVDSSNRWFLYQTCPLFSRRAALSQMLQLSTKKACKNPLFFHVTSDYQICSTQSKQLQHMLHFHFKKPAPVAFALGLTCCQRQSKVANSQSASHVDSNPSRQVAEPVANNASYHTI